MSTALIIFIGWGFTALVMVLVLFVGGGEPRSREEESE